MNHVNTSALRAASINRRTFTTGALALAAVPFTVLAQVTRKRRVGWLSPGVSMSVTSLATRQEFLNGMADLGWVEGRDFELISRFAENRFDRLPALAREMVEIAPDVIIATVNPATGYLREATSTIPIVMGFGSDAVAQGLAASLNRPGGNVTGIIVTEADGLIPKRLQFAHELVPSAKRIGVPLDASNPLVPSFRRAAAAAAESLKVSLILVEFRTADDLEPMFAMLKAQGAELVVAQGGNIFFVQSKRVGEIAAKLALPWIAQTREEVRDGAIFGYGTNVLAAFRRTAYFVDRILKGQKPGDIPIEFPTTFDLVVNLKVAKTLGIAIPATIMILATEVIE
jgi:putative tryptophan/tyrosine transport system substrate-binding protein